MVFSFFFYSSFLPVTLVFFLTNAESSEIPLSEYLNVGNNIVSLEYSHDFTNNIITMSDDHSFPQNTPKCDNICPCTFKYFNEKIKCFRNDSAVTSFKNFPEAICPQAFMHLADTVYGISYEPDADPLATPSMIEVMDCLPDGAIIYIKAVSFLLT
jgi:hypothetical protein